MKITKEKLSEYNKGRSFKARGKICHAPFSSLNFEQNGNITACCFNRVNVLGKYPINSIWETWTGEQANELRKKIKKGDLGGGCKLCGILINSGNFQGSKAIYYDEFAKFDPLQSMKEAFGFENFDFPRVFEFEISNKCNLLCSMCSGYYSSTIRKKREKLPPFASPYDTSFVRELQPFIPYLTDLKFLGGEPFLIDLYYEIWEKVVILNPLAKVHITTNGTILNEKVKSLLEKLNVGIILSLDSVEKTEYESIRQGAKFETVMENLEYFKKLTTLKKTYLSISACVMSTNWRGIPHLLAFANSKNIRIHFNLVWNPGHKSLRFFEFDQLQEVEAYFNGISLPNNSTIEKANKKTFEELLHSIQLWKTEKGPSILKVSEELGQIVYHNPSHLTQLIQNEDNPLSFLSKLLLKHYFENRKEQLPKELSNLSFENSKSVKQELFLFWQDYGDFSFTDTYFQLIKELGFVFFEKAICEEISVKSKFLKEHIQGMKEQQAVISDLIEDLDKKGIIYQLQLLQRNSVDSLIDHIKENY